MTDGFTITIEPREPAHLLGHKGRWVARCVYDHPPESIYTRTRIHLYADTREELDQKVEQWKAQMATE